jgi:hypothetical protein
MRMTMPAQGRDADRLLACGDLTGGTGDLLTWTIDSHGLLVIIVLRRLIVLVRLHDLLPIATCPASMISVPGGSAVPASPHPDDADRGDRLPGSQFPPCRERRLVTGIIRAHPGRPAAHSQLQPRSMPLHCPAQVAWSTARLAAFRRELPDDGQA